MSLKQTVLHFPETMPGRNSLPYFSGTLPYYGCKIVTNDSQKSTRCVVNVDKSILDIMHVDKCDGAWVCEKSSCFECVVKRGVIIAFDTAWSKNLYLTVIKRLYLLTVPYYPD